MAKVQPKSGNRRDRRATKAVERDKDKQKERAVRGLLAGAQKLQAQRQFMLKLLASLVNTHGGVVEIPMADLATSRDLGIEINDAVVTVRSVESKTPNLTPDQAQTAVVGGLEAMRELNDAESQAALTGQG